MSRFLTCRHGGRRICLRRSTARPPAEFVAFLVGIVTGVEKGEVLGGHFGIGIKPFGFPVAGSFAKELDLVGVESFGEVVAEFPALFEGFLLGISSGEFHGVGGIEFAELDFGPDDVVVDLRAAIQYSHTPLAVTVLGHIKFGAREGVLGGVCGGGNA